jgi:ketosteroid isomerase-like protein
VSAAVPQWLVDLYAQVDAAELNAYLEKYADDAVLRFGAAPAVRGKAAIREALGHGHARHAMAHTFTNVWTVGDTSICEFAVRYTMRDDGRVVDLPSLAILRRRPSDELIDDMRVYIDPTPLDAAAG